MSWWRGASGPALSALGILMSSSGCVSSSTWHAWHEVEARLEDVDAEALERGSERPEAAWRPVGSCTELVTAVLERSPELVAPRERARAALEEARAEGALPAPTARVSVWDFPIGDPSLADREGMYMLGVEQMLPPAGALEGRARAAVEEARVELAELDEVRRTLSIEAAHACVDWAGASAERVAREAWSAVLHRAAEALEVRRATGGEPLVDLARIERERAGAARAVRAAGAATERAAETLRALLGLPEDADLGPAPSLSRSAPELDAADLMETALARRGGLDAARARALASAARAEAAEAEASVPTFLVGGTYMQTPGARPGLMVELGMTLPWLWSGEPDMAAAARSEARAAEADIVAIERRVRVEVREAVAAVDATADTLALLRTVEAPASRRALAAVESAYRAGGSSLLDWLDAARAVRELEIEEVELLVELAHAVTEVSGALGASLDVEGRTVSGDDTEAAAARDASGDGLPTPDESARPTDLGASAAPMDDTSAPFGGAR